MNICALSAANSSSSIKNEIMHSSIQIDWIKYESIFDVCGTNNNHNNNDCVLEHSNLFRIITFINECTCKTTYGKGVKNQQQ